MNQQIINFLFGLSQERDDKDNLLEELSAALSEAEPYQGDCGDLEKALRKVGIKATVVDHSISFSDVESYRAALDVLSANMNDITDAGWVYAAEGSVNSTSDVAKFVINFVPVVSADEDNEKSDKVDLEKIASDACELGHAPQKDDKLRKDAEKKYDSYVKEGESADNALKRLLLGEEDSVRDWKVRVFDSQGNETDRWVIRNRTEAEARHIAEDDPAVQDASDWSMVADELGDMDEPAPVEESEPIAESGESAKEKLRLLLTSSGLARVDVGEGNDRFYASGDISRAGVTRSTLNRAVRRIFPDNPRVVSKRGNTLHVVVFKKS